MGMELLGNPKSEARNPNQIPMTKIPITPQLASSTAIPDLGFGIWGLLRISDFELRILNFPVEHNRPHAV
jgi:hypothetical protein